MKKGWAKWPNDQNSRNGGNFMKFTFETMLKDFKLYYPSFVENAEQIEQESDTELIAYQKDGSKVVYDQAIHAFRHFSHDYDSLKRTDEEVKLSFAIQLERAIRERGVTQSKLSEEIGVSQQTISTYLCGKQTPNVVTLFKLAKALGCSMNDLLRD